MYYLFISLCISYVYWHAHATARSQCQRTSCWSWFSPSTILDSTDWIQVVRQGSISLYLINHLFRLYIFLLNYFICLHSKCCPPSQCSLPEFFTIHFGSERVLPPTPTALLFQRYCSRTQTLCYLCFITLFPAQVDTKFQQFLISRNDFVE